MKEEHTVILYSLEGSIESRSKLMMTRLWSVRGAVMGVEAGDTMSVFTLHYLKYAPPLRVVCMAPPLWVSFCYLPTIGQGTWFL